MVDLLLRFPREKPLGTVGAIIVVVFLFSGIFADLLAPYPMDEIHLIDHLQPPSAQYLLGTDELGRDVLSRVIYGARISMLVGFIGSALGTSMAVFIGVLSGYFGGKLDIFLQRFVDAFQAIPSLFMILTVLAVVGSGLWQVIFVLGIRWGIISSRVVRSAVMGIKENMYISAAVAIGCPAWRVLTKHILVNIMAPIIVLATIHMGTMIIYEATISFLGLGIPPPTPSWGGMLSQSGRRYMLDAPWIALWPGLALSIVVYGINMFGDGLRDLLDPRLRGGAGRYGIAKVKKVQ